MDIHELLGRLDGVKGTGENAWAARCPAHADTNPSLSIGIGEGGRILLCCHAGCTQQAVADALNLKFSDLSGNGHAQPARPVPARPATKAKAMPPRKSAIVASYPYCNAKGELVYEVLRMEPKDFRQRRPDGNGGWIPNLKDTPRLLYRLPQLMAADPEQLVFISEGERDVDSLRDIGLTATTNSGGALKWSKLSDDSALEGRRVVILPDRDEPGRKHAVDVATRLHGRAAEVRIVELDGEGKDVSDWIEHHDSRTADELREMLLARAAAAPLWQPDEPKPATPPRPAAVVRNLSDITQRPIEWLWPDRFALGKLSMVVGDPGLGKSLLTLDLAARVSTGSPWPDAAEPPTQAQPGGVILLSGEDDPEDTIAPRLQAAYADLTKIKLLEAVRDQDRTGRDVLRTFNIGADLETLEATVASMGDCRLVIVDPLSCYLGQIDSHVNTNVRAVLSPLSDLAARRHIAVVAVSHLRKAGDAAALHRVVGSIAFTAAARAVYGVAKDSNDPSRRRRLFLPIKSNLAADTGGLAYTIQSERDVPRVAWHPGVVEVDVDEALDSNTKRGPDPNARNEAEEWLREALAEGPKATKELRNEAKAEGIAWRTLRRAKSELGVSARRTRFDGNWEWALSDGNGHSDT